jgi:hypothetical protein
MNLVTMISVRNEKKLLDLDENRSMHNFLKVEKSRHNKSHCAELEIIQNSDFQKSTVGSAADVGAAGKLGTFFHREHLGFDVAVDAGLVFQLTALGSDFAFDLAVNFDFASGDVALDIGVFTNRNFPFVGHDFAIDFAVDDHVVREADRTDDFDSTGEHVRRISHNCRKGNRGTAAWQ